MRICEDVINCNLEFYDFKSHTWHFCYLTNVISRKYNCEAELEVEFESQGKLYKVAFPYGRELHMWFNGLYAIILDDIVSLERKTNMPIVTKARNDRFSTNENNVAQPFVEREGIVECLTNQLILQRNPNFILKN